MKIEVECATCIVRQVVECSKEITDNKKEQFHLVKSTLSVIQDNYGENSVPAWMGTIVHRYLKKISNCNDPYRRLKEKADEIALKYVDIVREKVDKCNNDYEKFKVLVLGTIAGNTIDFGPYSTDLDIIKKIEETVNGNLQRNDLNYFIEDLKKSKKILYICDNAGEIVFDKLLIENILNYCPNVVCAVKGKPILNDATLEDAKKIGLTDIVKVIPVGEDIIGVILEECSEEFLKEFYSSDLIIAKGMGNFESLTEYTDEINKTKSKLYYIFKAKCAPVANYVGVNVGDNIMIRYDNI